MPYPCLPLLCRVLLLSAVKQKVYCKPWFHHRYTGLSLLGSSVLLFVGPVSAGTPITLRAIECKRPYTSTDCTMPILKLALRSSSTQAVY